MSAKERILQEATILFAEKGYTETTIKVIGKKAGFSGTALYRPYDSKEGLLNAIAHRFVENYSTGFLSKEKITQLVDSQSTRTFFKNFTDFFFQEKNQFLLDTIKIYLRNTPNNAHFYTLVNSILYDYPASLIEYAVKLFIERGKISPNLNIQVFSLALAQQIVWMAQKWSSANWDNNYTTKEWREYIEISNWLIDIALKEPPKKSVPQSQSVLAI